MMAQDSYGMLYRVFGINDELLYIGSVRIKGTTMTILPHKQSPDPRKQYWWKTEAKRVQIGEHYLSLEDFERLPVRNTARSAKRMRKKMN
jgi:hypothetical protein